VLTWKIAIRRDWNRLSVSSRPLDDKCAKSARRANIEKSPLRGETE